MLRDKIEDSFPGTSEAVKELRLQLETAAHTSLPVLLLGETGTGKELAARLIHELSDRGSGPFVTVNLAVLPTGLATAELVGHKRGAFTGADRSRRGLLEHANGGTLLLDEVGGTSLETQSLLLSLLDSGTVRALGATTSRKIDVRIISATNRALQNLAEEGRFRVDLLSRLSAIEIRMPSLRERAADIPELASYEIRRLSAELGKPFELAPDTIAALKGYNFPGNYRELRSLLYRAVATVQGRPIIHAGDLGLRRPSRRSTLKQPKSAALEAAQRSVEALRSELEVLRSVSIRAQPIWQGRAFPAQHDYAFVLMPFGEAHDLQSVYRDHVKPVIERCGLRCERADDIYDVSGVMQSVWEGINKARVLIADLTERNANVFYELGIAHTLGKPVIMISQSIDFVPFDLRHLRCILYTYTPRGASQLEIALERTIRTVLSSTIALAGV